MEGEALCVGDQVCLYSEDVYGYLHSFQSSCIHNELAVASRQDREKPQVPNCQVIAFELCIANRYKLTKAYQKLKAKSDANPDDLTLKAQCSQAEIGADAENEDNNSEQKRQLGKKVVYGQVIQLKHMFTGKFIHVSTTQTSPTEPSNIQVALEKKNTKHAQFCIMPRYKVKAEGDQVQVGDQVILESIKSPGQYLHVSKALFGEHSVYSLSHELNLSVAQSGFTVYRRYKPEPQATEMLRAGVPLRLFHKEIEAYLCAEGLFHDEITEDVHMRLRPMDHNSSHHMFPSTSGIVYWELEMETSPISGSVLRWGQQCRFRHMTTRHYLCVDANQNVRLTLDHRDSNAVFRLHPVVKQSDEIEFETYCRIEHVVTNTWLHALQDEYKRKQVSKEGDGNMSMTALQWTQAPLRQIGVSKEMRYDDAFTIQRVSDEHIEIFNYVAGMVPFLQKLIADKKDGMILKAKQTHEIVRALQELHTFLIVNNVPNKERQKLLRNLRIVELLVKLLQTPYRGSADQRHIVTLLVKCYGVLYTYLMGNSRKNELYIAKHIEFFNTQISYQGDIGLNAAKMVMQLVKDNRKIVDRITHKHIDNFIDLLRQKKNYSYLDLLSVLCICDGVSISDNQTYITKAWLMQGQKNCVYHTELGEKIHRTPGVVYVSTDNRHHWVSLHEFVRDVRKAGKSETDNERMFSRDHSADEEYLFLRHQLDLFGHLCAGRNSFAIQVITEDLCYLTIEEAFLCLRDELLPDELRSVYCSLINDTAVDVGDSTSVVDTINLTFLYDQINDVDSLTPRPTLQRDSEKGAMLLNYIAQLREWLSQFLATNMDMTASEIGHNMLLEQVLRLIYCLVKFGHYGNMDDMKQLLEPLLSLLNGRNDKPYPHEAVLQSVQDHYSTKLRFKQSPETKAIVNAKCQAMVVLDLFYNFQFNIRLEGFMQLFRVTYAKAHHSTEFVPELGTLLSSSYDIYEQANTNRAALKCLAQLFQKSDYFGSFSLTDILLDLSDYDYDAMVVKSLALLNRQYSASASLFKYAVQAQILITDESERVHNELCQVMPEMKRMTAAKMSDEQISTMSEILDKLIKFCSLMDDPEESHAMNQSILYNHRVLGTVFDILSQEVDVKLKDQYESTLVIFRKCFTLLKLMARGNTLVQQRLFDRLDLILSIQGTEPQMAEALIEVFTGNKDTCLKILPHQIQKIMSLAATHTNNVPQFLDLLNAIVKLEEFNMPLKRNQTYVMKFFMQYRAEVAYVIDQPKEQRMKLREGPLCPDLIYLITVVDLLATCAEGENRFIESICQTIFVVEELMEALNDEDMSLNLKKPYVRFLMWVYLNTASGVVESGAGDLAHCTEMWDYLNGLSAILSTLTAYATANPDTVKQLLKKVPAKVDCSRDERSSTWCGLHYILESVMPFLQVFYHRCYQANHVEFPKEANYTDTLANSLMEFTRQVGPMVCNGTHMKTLVSCMSVIMSVSTLPVEVMQEFEQRYGNLSKVHDIRGDARKKYDEYYAQEQELNEQLNTFATNFSMVYGGRNTLRAQIGYPSDKEYSELGGDEELPLGAEFQEHMLCFVEPQARSPQDQYRQANKLIKQLAISTSRAWQGEKDRLEQEALDIKSLQLLRGLIHNEIVKLPDNWQPGVSATCKQLKQVEHVQNGLNHYEAVVHVLPHLAMHSDSLVRESLAFIVMMLFGGNRMVQRSCSSYFLGTREEKFFFAIKNRMLMAIMATKEKRNLQTSHQQKVDEAVQQAKSLRKAMRDGHMAEEAITSGQSLGVDLLNTLSSRSSMRLSDKKSKSLKAHYGSQSMFGGHFSQGSRYSLNKTRPAVSPSAVNGIATDTLKGFGRFRGSGHTRVSPANEKKVGMATLDSTELVQLVEETMEEEEMEYHDEGYIELVLRMMGSMCDGQNTTLQDYLREQPDNIKSVNLIAETAQFLGLVYGSVNNKNIILITEIFITLVELSLGNNDNKLVVFDCKVCDYINCILRRGNFHRCSDLEILGLKESIATLIVALIEEDFSKAGIGAKEIIEMIDGETVWQVAKDCFQRVNSNSEQGMSRELRKKTKHLGFKFYHILCRLQQLDSTDRITPDKLVTTPEDSVIWEKYSDSTLSIEIIKDDKLQKIHFRCKDKSVLREEVKEKFKYEVDRSSPSNKLRELMEWTNDITQDINYTRRMLKNSLARFFVRYWWHFNMGMIFMSFVFFVLMLATWRQPNDITSAVPVYVYPDQVKICVWILGGIHNACSFCVLISYIIVNHPTLPRFKPLRRLHSYLTTRKKTEVAEDPDDDRSSNLEVTFFSFKTFWYLILVVSSCLGTVFYGYFFSFHLLHIAEFNQLLKRTIRAITQNGMSLMWVFIYGLIIIYIYALLGFAFYRELFDAQTGLYCTTLYECSLTMLHRGFTLGIVEFLQVPDGKPFVYHLFKAIFDLTFFIVITTIGLNIIFGIIVDTFSELRDNKWQVESDMHNVCFICSRSNYDFEHHGSGFEHHVKEEHNQWAYVFFFIHLDETRTNDYTALELYISEQMAKKKYDFFPVNRALSLQHEEDDSEVRLQTMMSYITYLVTTHKQEEAARERELEQKRQKAWELAHRGEPKQKGKK